MKNKILLIALMLFSAFASGAAEPVRFTASAPSTVIVDKPFQLVYTVNATGKDLKVPEFKTLKCWLVRSNHEAQVIRLSTAKPPHRSPSLTLLLYRDLKQEPIRCPLQV
jgi:hypothetical protein